MESGRRLTSSLPRPDRRSSACTRLRYVLTVADHLSSSYQRVGDESFIDTSRRPMRPSELGKGPLPSKEVTNASAVPVREVSMVLEATAPMKIAILGSRGYPSTYGGFETLVRRLA